MARIALITAFLLALPYLSYWLWYRSKIRRGTENEAMVANDWPVARLGLISLCLLAGTLIVLAVMQPDNKGKCYEPPQYVDGELQKGYYFDCDTSLPSS